MVVMEKLLFRALHMNPTYESEVEYSHAINVNHIFSFCLQSKLVLCTHPPKTERWLASILASIFSVLRCATTTPTLSLILQWCIIVPVECGFFIRCLEYHTAPSFHGLTALIVSYFMIDTFSFVIQQPLFNLQPC